LLTGRFADRSGRPYLQGRLILPRFDLVAEVWGLIDTGADTSLLNPRDGGRLSLDYGQLEGNSQSAGVGGALHSFVEPAVLTFIDSGRKLYAYFLNLDVSPPNPAMEQLPSTAR
jgi:hypothetical protein